MPQQITEALVALEPARSRLAAHLAPALLHGGADYSVEEIAVCTGLTLDRVRDSLELLSEHGCVRQVGRAPDGAPFYVLP
ncbi:hypothetical protein ACFYSF_17235 [Streptomyces canus]|uniref:hypothetical protein n=1 Tax=Streptomyces canus TaxID=58343 RepID=UPI0036C6741D